MQAYIFILFFVLSEAVVRLPNSPIDWLRMHFPTQTLHTPTTVAVHFREIVQTLYVRGSVVIITIFIYWPKWQNLSDFKLCFFSFLLTSVWHCSIFLQRSPQDHPPAIQKCSCCLSSLSVVCVALGRWNIRT